MSYKVFATSSLACLLCLCCAALHLNAQCIDSDGGDVPAVFGTVAVLNSATKAVLKTVQDSCTPDGLNLREFRCASTGEPQGYFRRCEYACVDGACAAAPRNGKDGCYLEVKVKEERIPTGEVHYSLSSTTYVVGDYFHRLRPADLSQAGEFELHVLDASGAPMTRYVGHSSLKPLILEAAETMDPIVAQVLSAPPLAGTTTIVIPYQLRMAYLAVSAAGKRIPLNSTPLSGSCLRACIQRYRVGDISKEERCCPGLVTGPRVASDTNSYICVPDSLDSDADGTPDSADCLPQDAKAWRTGKFYRDSNGDRIGDSEVMYELCYGILAPANYTSTPPPASPSMTPTLLPSSTGSVQPSVKPSSSTTFSPTASASATQVKTPSVSLTPRPTPSASASASKTPIASGSASASSSVTTSPTFSTAPTPRPSSSTSSSLMPSTTYSLPASSTPRPSLTPSAAASATLSPSSSTTRVPSTTASVSVSPRA